MTTQSTLGPVLVFLISCLLISTFYSHQYIRTIGQSESNTSSEILTSSGQAPIDHFNVQAVPTSDSVTINYHSTSDFKGEIVVANILGKRVQEIQNAFKEGQQQVDLDFSELSEGLYLIALSDGMHQKTQRFRLQRTSTSP